MNQQYIKNKTKKYKTNHSQQKDNKLIQDQNSKNKMKPIYTNTNFTHNL